MVLESKKMCWAGDEGHPFIWQCDWMPRLGWNNLIAANLLSFYSDQFGVCLEGQPNPTVGNVTFKVNNLHKKTSATSPGLPLVETSERHSSYLSFCWFFRPPASPGALHNPYKKYLGETTNYQPQLGNLPRISWSPLENPKAFTRRRFQRLACMVWSPIWSLAGCWA